MDKTKRKKKAGSPKGKRPNVRAHRCGVKCAHTCGEAGGRAKKKRTPCTRPGCWGIKGAALGHWGPCKDHSLAKTDAKREDAPTELMGREAAFVLYYVGLANGNATEAAKRAGYADPKNRASLQVAGSLLLNRPKIKAAILRQYDELAASSAEIIKRITDDARMSITPLLEFGTQGVKVRLTPEIMEQFGTLIKEIESDPETGYITKLKLNDSQAARRDLAKIHKLYTTDTTVNVALRLGDLSDEELAARLAAATLRLRGPRAAEAQHSGG